MKLLRGAVITTYVTITPCSSPTIQRVTMKFWWGVDVHSNYHEHFVFAIHKK